MKFIYNSIDNTFIVGISFINFFDPKHGKMNTTLIFEFGKRSFAIIFRGEKCV